MKILSSRTFALIFSCALLSGIDSCNCDCLECSAHVPIEEQIVRDIEMLNNLLENPESFNLNEQVFCSENKENLNN